jgi:hypothetical protein
MAVRTISREELKGKLDRGEGVIVVERTPTMSVTSIKFEDAERG